MFTWSEIQTLTTWPAGDLVGLKARWAHAAAGSAEFVEVYRSSDPDVAVWQLWKPSVDVFLVYEVSSDRLMTADTLALALAIVVCNEFGHASGARKSCLM